MSQLSHTCFFTLDLPPYSTEEIMYERLNYAITHCSSIDGDYGLNEPTMQPDLDEEEDISSTRNTDVNGLKVKLALTLKNL
ncbi:unnamed protein product [Didymodactylos carnosus]|uniref:HECT domain-containing protein n=1 Tax=Didymodactylos carnosus TaxID=1234261 RepID=A0A8S2E9Z4_9BILA|nr:unnamed protein product [Didymodactylos carnosus]CAF3885056.1 unnamed protein product [Didymodactylos carnosus]